MKEEQNVICPIMQVFVGWVDYPLKLCPHNKWFSAVLWPETTKSTSSDYKSKKLLTKQSGQVQDKLFSKLRQSIEVTTREMLVIDLQPGNQYRA